MMIVFDYLKTFAVIVFAVIAGGFYLAIDLNDHRILGALMAIVSVILFFGVLLVTLKTDAKNNPERIRLALAATILIEYFIYFGTVIYLPVKSASSAEDLLTTLTTIIAAVFAFYFAVETGKYISENISKRKERIAKYKAMEKIAESIAQNKKAGVTSFSSLIDKLNQAGE